MTVDLLDEPSAKHGPLGKINLVFSQIKQRRWHHCLSSAQSW